jgi:predicted metallo-beta-lactamase superfamily hydrolase
MMISRAVLRQVEPGNTANCAHCGAPIKFAARMQLRQVIANVYQEGNWIRVEHYHADCYDEAGQPYGEAAEKP